MTAANTLKTTSRMLTVGVGGGLTNVDSAKRLRTISGPKMSNQAGLDGKSINEVDAVAVPDFEQLANALKTIVTQLCRSSVTVTKWVSQQGAQSPLPGVIPNGFVKATTPQWPITLAPTVNGGGSFTWVTPSSGQMPVLTDSSTGAAQFQWKPNPIDRGSTAAISETEPGRLSGWIRWRVRLGLPRSEPEQAGR